MMNVSIIIVNYNTKVLLGQCLESVFEMTRDIAFEVLVVDNASSDGSEEYITSKFADVVWINSGGNLGFGRANNLGAEHAKGEYLFLLNSDTILKNNAVKIFYDYMQSHKDERIGALGAWLYDDMGGINHSCGVFPTIKSELSYLLSRLCLSSKRQNVRVEKDVDFIIGADLFIPKVLFLDLDGFDDNIFMYYEETDLQLRVCKEGYIRRIITEPYIIHLEGGSFEPSEFSIKRYKLSQASYGYYIKKHFKGVSRFILSSIMYIVRYVILFRVKIKGS